MARVSRPSGLRQQPGAASSATAAARTPTTRAALTPPTLPATPQKTLKQALALVNATVWTTGFLPPQSCTFVSPVSAECSKPYPGITMAFFQNYSSPAALYKAYEAAIKQANNGRFVVNVQDCGASAPPGTVPKSHGTTSARTPGRIRSSSWNRAR